MHCCFVLMGHLWKFLEMKASVELAFLDMSEMWLLKVSLLSMVMPRYLAAFVGWRGWAGMKRESMG